MTLLKNSSFFFPLLVCLACSPAKKNPEAAVHSAAKDVTEISLTADEVKSAGIKIGKTERRQVSGIIKVNGVLDVPPQNLVSVSAPLGGFVKHTDLLQGMKVRQGQTLVTLEGPEYIQLQEDFLGSKSQLDYMKLEYDRQQELARENVNAAKAVQLARSNFMALKARTAGLEAKLQLVHIDPALLEREGIQTVVTVRSPIAGFVSQVNINIGMHVNPTDVMFRIIDTEHLHAEAQVFEKDLTRLKIGQKVRVLLSNDVKERIASVYLIGREVTADRTIRVHCHFEGEDASLIPGMYFSAVIEVANQSVPALPNEAIVAFEGKKYIFAALDHSRFAMKEIATGASESGYTEVTLSDSLATADVVVRGAYELLSRLKNSEE